MSDVVVVEVPSGGVDVTVPPGAVVCIEVGGSGGTGVIGPTYTGFTFWPRTLDFQLVVPDDHTLPIRDLVIIDDGEIVIGTDSEVLVF